MGRRAGEPEGICGGVSVGFEFEELLCDGVHDVCMFLVVRKESPDEGRQRRGGRVGLKDVLGSRDWHCGGRREGNGMSYRVGGLYTIFYFILLECS